MQHTPTTHRRTRTSIFAHIAATALLAAAVGPTQAQVSEITQSPATHTTQPTPAKVAITQTALAADETSTATALSPRWPDRWGNFGEAKGMVIDLGGGSDDWVGRWLGPYSRHVGMSREVGEAMQFIAAGGDGEGARYRFEGPGSYLFLQRISPEAAIGEGDRPVAPPGEHAFVYYSAREADGMNVSTSLELQRTWFVLSDALDAAGKPTEPRGFILLAPGMLGTPKPVLDGLVRAARPRGWAVLRMLGHPSRFTARAIIPVDIEHDAEGAADRIAELFTQRCAEAAYASDAAVHHAYELDPRLADVPLVCIGMSGGAMAMPTIIAREHELYDAVVLIGGGADFLAINERSNYAGFIDAIHLDWDAADHPGKSEDDIDTDALRPPTESELTRLSELYIERAPLDAYHTAAALEGKPVLMLHAERDRAVPADLGDLLWQRLGKPERWQYPFGHELLFAALPTQLGRVFEWLDTNVLAESPAAPAEGDN